MSAIEIEIEIVIEIEWPWAIFIDFDFDSDFDLDYTNYGIPLRRDDFQMQSPRLKPLGALFVIALSVRIGNKISVHGPTMMVLDESLYQRSAEPP